MWVLIWSEIYRLLKIWAPKFYGNSFGNTITIIIFFYQEPFERLVRESAHTPTDFTYESPDAPTTPEELANLLLGTASPDIQKKPSILNSFLFNRSIYVVLAILLNLLIILQIDNPIGKVNIWYLYFFLINTNNLKKQNFFNFRIKVFKNL